MTKVSVAAYGILFSTALPHETYNVFVSANGAGATIISYAANTISQVELNAYASGVPVDAAFSLSMS